MSQRERPEEGLSSLVLQLARLVGLGPQAVSLVQLEGRTQVDGVVPSLAAQRWPLARRAHGAHQRRPLAHGVRVAPHAVAERGDAHLLALAAGDPVGRLAVDEVESAPGDHDLVVLQLEAPLEEGLALVAPPLHLAPVGPLLIMAWGDGAKHTLSTKLKHSDLTKLD